MITRETKPRYFVGEREFKTLREAQEAALEGLLPEPRAGVAAVLLDNASRVLDILTTTEKSLARARKVNGGSKRRKGKEKAREWVAEKWREGQAAQREQAEPVASAGVPIAATAVEEDSLT